MPKYISKAGDWQQVPTTSSPEVEVKLEKKPVEEPKPTNPTKASKKTVKKSKKSKESSNA